MTPDRAFKYTIAQQYATAAGPKDSSDSNISEIEENIVCYMSGYVAVKLLEKYRKGSANSTAKKKWQYFVRVLKEIKCED